MVEPPVPPDLAQRELFESWSEQFEWTDAVHECNSRLLETSLSNRMRRMLELACGAHAGSWLLSPTPQRHSFKWTSTEWRMLLLWRLSSSWVPCCMCDTGPVRMHLAITHRVVLRWGCTSGTAQCGTFLSVCSGPLLPHKRQFTRHEPYPRRPPPSLLHRRPCGCQRLRCPPVASFALCASGGDGGGLRQKLGLRRRCAYTTSNAGSVTGNSGQW